MISPKIIRELEQRIGSDGVLASREDLMLYDYDGSVEKASPDLVVLPRTREHVVHLVRLANREQIPIVARGAGTGLSGGALARQGGILLVFSRMNRILEIDFENLCAVVEPGVVNQDLTDAVSAEGLFFAPDPSSQKACTIGGNVAENAGGPHTLAYGVTTNHVLGLEVVLPDGEIVEVGGKSPEPPGYDLVGLLVGSEGTLSIVTKIIVRLSRLPEAVKTLLAIYDAVNDAPETVAEITARAITPTACEMLDGFTLKAVEEYIHAGFPLDSAAVLLIELEGLEEAVAAQAVEIIEIAKLHHAREVRIAKDAEERALLWAGRKNAFGAIGRLSPAYYVQDGVIPRTKLAITLRKIDEIGQRYGFRIGNIFHAGDGNLHPLILFDPRDHQQYERVVAASNEIMRFCVEMGGSITGEHGVGMEKNELMPLLFSDADLEVMRRVKDVFNPTGLLNPGKMFPTTRTCGEVRVRPLPVTAS